MHEDRLVVSECCEDLPEEGTAILVRKDGTKWRFHNGNFAMESAPKKEKQDDDTLIL